MISLAWLIPLFPVLGVLINGLFGARYVREKAGYVACAATGLSFLVVLGVAAEMSQNAQLDLRVVGRQQSVSWRGYERAADLPPEF